VDLLERKTAGPADLRLGQAKEATSRPQTPPNSLCELIHLLPSFARASGRRLFGARLSVKLVIHAVDDGQASGGQIFVDI
jgi:hypothetical protein